MEKAKKLLVVLLCMAILSMLTCMAASAETQTLAKATVICGNMPVLPTTFGASGEAIKWDYSALSEPGSYIVEGSTASGEVVTAEVTVLPCGEGINETIKFYGKQTKAYMESTHLFSAVYKGKVNIEYDLKVNAFSDGVITFLSGDTTSPWGTTSLLTNNFIAPHKAGEDHLYIPELGKKYRIDITVDTVGKVWSSKLTTPEGEVVTLNTDTEFSTPLEGIDKVIALRNGVTAGYVNDVEITNLKISGNSIPHYNVTQELSGQCGDSLTYTKADGVLTISGSGDMWDYSADSAPRYDLSSDITSVVIEDGVTSIGNYAFYGGSNITSVSIPESVTRIGKSSFYGAKALRKIEIPSGVKSMESNAFYGCTNLGGVYITDLTAWLNIDFNANSYANPLAHGEYLYLNGSLVSSITIPDDVKVIKNYVFTNCYSLKSLIIPSCVVSIERGAFSDCHNLSSVAIENGVQSMEAYALSGCQSLESIHLPKSLKDIDRLAFRTCWQLSRITVDSENPYYTSVNGVLYNKDVTKLLIAPIDISYCTIPDGVTCIGQYAFDFSGIRSVTIPASVQCIENEAFTGCANLSAVYISDLAAWCAIDFENASNPLVHAKKLYINGVLATDAVIPDGVTSINKYAFWNCESIKSVTIPASVTSIGANAFASCKLTRVNIEDLAAWCNVELAYEDSNPLHCADELYVNGSPVYDLVIPDGVTSIGDYVFANCNGIKSVTIPTSVTSIGEGAFNGCSKLTNIYYEGSERQWNEISGNIFDNVTVQYAIDEAPTLTSYIGYDENGELAIMFDAGDYNEGNTVEITSELGNTVYSGVVTDEKNIFAITPKNANVTYTAKITLEDGTVLEEKAALYQALAKDCAENLKEYANVDLSLINREGIASGVKAISEGGAVLVEGKLTAEAARMMDVYKNEKETVIAIKPQLTRIGLGFGYYEGSKIYAGSGVLASADSYGIYSRITIDNETGAAVLNNGVVVVTSTFGAEAVPIPANAIIINDNTGESVEGFDYWK